MAENIMKAQQSDLTSLMERAARRNTTVPFEGYSREDGNIPGNIMVASSDECVYSFAKSDIMEREQLGEDRVRVWVRAGATAFRLSRIRAGESQDSFTVAMENIAPPASPRLAGDPTPASGAVTAEQMEHIAPPPTEEPAGAPRYAGGDTAQVTVPRVLPPLSSVGSCWTASCLGGDMFANNCAHFLSDAFIRAGYTELAMANPYIHARCYTPARRPIRARDMWAWFQNRAVRTSHTPMRNTGWWSVFQLDESVYWGGHVLLLDTDTWTYYGTGNHTTWQQYLYQW
ncbi:hypothetical protein HCJ76_06200 [Streptomyces sp. MC1]|uniref:hypothetical protein n=1 Tax=Streptomyces sp. MC1 TaxID=295105 RepID=UPI0018CABB0F|nr:hypothetical protein [Streptomyces sp. MC1]MBG7697681.1 hypothetical protein [Streptomyces sp. MC1]